MDYQGQETNYTVTEYQPASSQETKQPPNAMAAASLVMGILALVTCCCCYGGMIFGGLGILFALLSRGDGSLEGQAKAGMILSIIGLILGILTLAAIVGIGIWGSVEAYQGFPEVQQIPAVPDMPRPAPEDLFPENLLTILRQFKMGGGR